MTFLGLFIIRFLGGLETLEIQSLDRLFQQRKSEPVDERIVMVEITESDIFKFKQYPITDYELYKLLSKIQEQKPRVIGIDILRDLPVAPNYFNGEQKLNAFYNDPANSNVFGIVKIIQDKEPVARPFPILSEYGQIGSIDLVSDRDGAIRRAVLWPDLKEHRDLPSLNYILAAEYLKKEGIELNEMQLGKIELQSINSNSGGYVGIDSGGEQIFLNYRSHPNDFLTVKAIDLIEGKTSADILKDKIIIICTRTESFPDIFYTPFLDKNGLTRVEVYGGWIQANATSQLISAVLDNRPLIRVLPTTSEYLVVVIFIFGIICWGDFLDNKFSQNTRCNFYIAILIILLGLCLQKLVNLTEIRAFVNGGWWLPQVPVFWGIIVAGIVEFIAILTGRIRQYQTDLETTNIELEEANIKLFQANSDLSQFLNALPVGVYICDRTGRTKYINQTAKKILGDRLKEIENLEDFKKAYPLSALTEKSRQEWPIDPALKGCQPTPKEVKVSLDNQKSRPLELMATPIYNEQKQIVSDAIATFTDITQRLSDRAEREKLSFENELLKDTNNQGNYEYFISGSVPPGSPTYVTREADRNLYRGLIDGKFCYIFNARQMGKSSLRLKIQKLFASKGFACGTIDLNGIVCKQTTLPQWYNGLIIDLISSFGKFLDGFDYREWKKDFTEVSPLIKFRFFIEKVLLVKIKTTIIIFIDEVDSILNLNFSCDDFFGLIRFFYERRNDNPLYNRLNFVLLGRAEPAFLVRDKSKTPFNLACARSIYLEGFTYLEATKPLSPGLKSCCDRPENVLKEILFWTSGQPMLTQKLCALVVAKTSYIPINKEANFIKNLVVNEIITDWQSIDQPRHFGVLVENLLEGRYDPIALLKLYRDILNSNSGAIKYCQSVAYRELYLSGIARKTNGQLTVYNRIYSEIFNLNWVERELALLSKKRSCDP
ncbi:MAG: CHASE2 domain-containing protein [Prochloraceae cyanobacterium]